MTSPKDWSEKDWLGYAAYAEALWLRAQGGFESRAGAPAAPGSYDLPTGDPLVVGVYGEWGVGKTRLLELVYDKIHSEALTGLARRALDPHAFDKELSITLPVWFHPWKYEHEPAIVVPLLMHVSDALRTYLKDSRTLTEAALQAVAMEQHAVAEVQHALQEKVGILTTLLSGAHKVASLQITRTVAGVAGGMIGLGDEARGVVEWLGETAGKLSGGVSDDDEKKGGGEPAENKRDPETPEPRLSADGSFYYNVHRHLRELSRITPTFARKLGVTLNHDIRLNFVILIDDLDRCLPEKAVEVLEVVKTIMNVECFAFIAALDDEIIERGIAHRYKDYRFQGLKPEMPITGFEYLEKIIHLPFRLPQLTRAQAEQFVLHLEDRLVAGDKQDLPRLWFAHLPPAETSPSVAPASNALPGDASKTPTPLVNMLLDSFESYVPRKLARTVESLHYQQSVLARRGIALKYGTLGEMPDARLLLGCTLLQLFAPELFRMLRRRTFIWREWMLGYLPHSSGSPAFYWRKPADAALTIQVSDASLYRWVALGADAMAPNPAMAASKSGVPEWRANLSRWFDELSQMNLDPQARFTAEQVRLPWVQQVCELRDAQRHAFDPMRLGAAITATMQWQTTQVPALAPYFQLFAEAAPMATPQTPMAPSELDVPEGSKPAPVHEVDVPLLLDIIRSSDRGTRLALAERLNLAPGEVIPTDVWVAVKEALDSGKLTSEAAFDAIVMLASWVQVSDFLRIEQIWDWQGLPRWNVFKKTDESKSAAPELVVQEARALDAVVRAGFGEQMLGATAEQARQALLVLLEDSRVQAQLRAEAGDLIDSLGGDPRFEFAAPLFLPTRRFGLEHRQPGQLGEPVAGFVFVPKGAYVRRSSRGDGFGEAEQLIDIRSNFLLARTLVTVRQWNAFIDAGGYHDRTLWDQPQGWEWRRGRFSSLVESPAYLRSTITNRSMGSRSRPSNWKLQTAFKSRPVTGVTWFEARAYARWVDRQLRKSLDGKGLTGYRVRLPTEVEWERAARARDPESADDRAWPFDGTPQTAGQFANLKTSQIERPSAVGCFAPNAIGIFDLGGNVWEWQDNLFGEAEPLAWTPIEDNLALEVNVDLAQAGRPAVRGGSWSSVPSTPPPLCLARAGLLPDHHDANTGIRLVIARP